MRKRLVAVSTMRMGLVAMGFIVLTTSLLVIVNASGFNHLVGRAAAAFGAVTFLGGIAAEFLLERARPVVLGMIWINVAVALFGYVVVLDFSTASHLGMVGMVALALGLTYVTRELPAASEGRARD